MRSQYHMNCYTLLQNAVRLTLNSLVLIPTFVVFTYIGCDCPRILDPVCGIDDVTYPNKCEAECSGVKLKCDNECGKCCPSGYTVAIDGLLSCEDGYAIDLYSSQCARCKPTRCEGLPLATCLEPNNPDLTCSWDNGICQKGNYVNRL